MQKSCLKHFLQSFLFLNLCQIQFFLFLRIGIQVSASKIISQSSNFLASLIHNEFYECNLFILTSIESPGKDEDSGRSITTTDVLEKSLMDFHEGGPGFFLADLNDKNSSFGNNQPLNKDFKYNTYESVSRLSSHCSLVLSYILTDEAETSTFFSLFSRLLLPDLDCIVKKDEDYFIFVAHDENASETVLLAEISMQIKFKLGISSITAFPSENFLIKSTCFYCEQGGPKIIDVLDVQVKAQGKEHWDFKNRNNTEDENKQIQLFLSKGILFPDYVRNGYGRVLRNSCQTRLLFMVEIQKQKNGQWKYTRGYAWTVLNEILTKFNFTYIAFPAYKTGGSGTLRNGQWDGIVSDIYHNRADIGLAVTTDASRFKVIGGTKPISFLQVNYILGQPNLTYDWKAIFFPLSSDVWFLTLISSCITVGMFYLMKGLSAQETEQKNFNENPFVTTKHGKVDLNQNRGDVFHSNIIGNIVAGILEQSMSFPCSSRARFLCGTFLLTSLVLRTGYRSKLIGLMVFPMFDEQPKNYRELATSDYSWGLESSAIGSSGHNFFLTSPSTLHRRIYKQMEFEENTKACFYRAVKSKFACLTFDQQAEFMIYRNFSSSAFEKLPLHIFGNENVGFSMPAIALKKRALYRTNFDMLIDRMTDSGVILKTKMMDFAKEREAYVQWAREEKRKKKLYSTSSTSDHDVTEGDGPVVLKLNNLYGTFYLLLFGSFSAVFEFIAEVTWCIIFPKVLNIFRKLINRRAILKRHLTRMNQTSGGRRKKEMRVTVVEVK